MKFVLNAIWRYIRQTDLMLITVTLLASVLGFLLVFSATHGEGRTMWMQLVGIGIGFVCMIVISKIDYHTMADLWKIIAVASVLLLLSTLVFGSRRQGTGGSLSADQSWIWIGPVSLQPAELVKIAFVITFSKHFDLVKDRLTEPLQVLLLTLHGMVPIGIIVLTKDMGMALVFILIFVFMMFAANVQLRYFALAGVAVLISAPFIWNHVFGSTQIKRIITLFDPNKYPDVALQQLSARSAIGSGMLWGYGLFHGPRTQSAYSTGQLPEKQNDMIFAVAGEELGFIGCMIIFILFILLLARMVSNARHAKDPLGSMICIGIFASFAVQMLINVGMVLMLLPVIGISLPFFSSGATSMVSSYMAVGLVLSVHTHRKMDLFRSARVPAET